MPNEYADYILSPEQYFQITHEKPYLYKIDNNNSEKSVLFFGAKHLADPSDPMFPQLRQKLEEFEPDLVMVEAAPGPQGLSREEFNKGIIEQSEEHVIQRRGEPGFSIRLAVEHDIEWFCPEPGRTELFDYVLSEGYSKEEIQAWALFRDIPVFNKRRGERTFDEFANTSISHFLERTQWELDSSLERIIQIGIRLIGEEVDVKNDMEIHKYINPGTQNKMQEISRLTWIYRDTFILEHVIDKLEEYNRIFMVYGSSHAVVLEPALRKLFITL